MLSFPSLHVIAVLVLTGITFWAFARERLRIELICLLLIAVIALGFYFFPLSGEHRFTGMEIAFGGFGHEALITICCLMIVGRGLSVTGALDPATRILGRVWRFNHMLGFLLTIFLAAGLSMFINDTPVLVVLLPMLLSLSARTGVSASKTLMPVNYAILIGGMATTIGTSTNVLAVSLAEDLGVPAFGVFEFTGIVLVAAAIALPYLWIVMPRLLPDKVPEIARANRRYEAVLHVTSASAILGLSLSDLSRQLGEAVTVRGVSRGEEQFYELPAGVQSGDHIHVCGTKDELMAAAENAHAPLIHPGTMKSIQMMEADPAQILAEVVIGPQCNLIGESVRSSHIGERYRVGVLAASFSSMRNGKLPRPTDDMLFIGDSLLVMGSRAQLHDMETNSGVLILDGAAEMPLTGKSALAVAIAAGVILLAVLGIVPIAISALGGAILMLGTGCVRFDHIGKALSGEVVVLVAASIALGRAFLETGAAAWLAGLLGAGLESAPPAATLAVIMMVTAMMTNFVSNSVAVAVFVPVAVALANQLGINAQPMVLAVLFGANLSFVTPMAYQTNLLIMRPGGYQFADYVRAGLPLAILMVVSLSVLLVLSYGL